MLDFVQSFMTDFLEVVLNFLPTSPFQRFIQSVENLPYLSYLNWFIPVGTIISIGQAWLTAIGIFYFYSIVLRWLRAID